MKRSIQSYYPQEYSYCWGCGQNHPNGLHLESFFSNEGEAVMKTIPEDCYSGGVPGFLYGGYIAMLFDCHGTGAAAGFFLLHRNEELSEKNMKRFVTAHLEVDYKRPTPMQEELTITAKPVEIGERKVTLQMEMKCRDTITATARMVAVYKPIAPEH